MLLWEYLFAADQRRDLADAVTALEWLHGQPWGVRGEWPESTAKLWQYGIWTLRSQARRLKGRRPRRFIPPGEANELEADRVARFYLSLMRLCEIRPLPKHGPVRLSPLDHSFRGLHVLPTYYLPPDAQPKDANGKPLAGTERQSFEWAPGQSALDQLYFWIRDGEVFWQLVFHSLQAGIGPAVCWTCGRCLGSSTTKLGKQKKQKQCGRCRQRVYFDKKPVAERRKKWRDDYGHKQDLKRRNER